MEMHSVHASNANDAWQAGTRMHGTIVWSVIYTFLNAAHLSPAMCSWAFINAISHDHQFAWIFGGRALLCVIMIWCLAIQLSKPLSSNFIREQSALAKSFFRLYITLDAIQTFVHRQQTFTLYNTSVFTKQSSTYRKRM